MVPIRRADKIQKMGEKKKLFKGLEAELKR